MNRGRKEEVNSELVKRKKKRSENREETLTGNSGFSSGKSEGKRGLGGSFTGKSAADWSGETFWVIEPGMNGGEMNEVSVVNTDADNTKKNTPFFRWRRVYFFVEMRKKDVLF